MKIKWQWFVGGRDMFWVSIILLHKGDYKDQKANLRSFKRLKRAIRFKTCLCGAFD